MTVTGSITVGSTTYENVDLELALPMMQGLQATLVGGPVAVARVAIIRGDIEHALNQDRDASWSYSAVAKALLEILVREKPGPPLGAWHRANATSIARQRRLEEIDMEIGVLLTEASTPPPPVVVPEPVRELKELLLEHEVDFAYDGSETGCSCGWSRDRGASVQDDFNGHLAELLLAHGVRIGGS